MIAPLFESKSNVEVLNFVSGGADDTDYNLVRATWGGLIRNNFEKGWRKVLHDGVLEGSASRSSTPSLI